MGSIEVRNTVLQSFSMVESKELEREMKITLSARSTSSSLTRPTLPMPDKDRQSPHHVYIVWSMMKF